MSTARKAVVLLSGGLDSATVLAMAQAEGFEVAALSFHYGQRHDVELEAARQVAAAGGVKRHVELEIDLRQFGGSALTGDLPVPKTNHPEEIGDEIPVTYVPARNTIFLSFALGFAEVLETGDIFIGVNAVDYSGYPDCRPEFIRAFGELAKVATKAAVEHRYPVEIHTPLIAWTKTQIIREGLELGVDYSLTTSCYDPDRKGYACGRCDACHLRRRGFAENGIRDPIRYRDA